MRQARNIGAIAIAILAGAIPVIPSPAPVSAVATLTTALYEMNEPNGSTVLVDTSGNAKNGAIGPNVVEATVVDGATGHRFLNRSPTALPVEPERLDTVPHTTLHNPDAADFAVSIRYRTDKAFGNIIQKGQNGTVGGYFKIELPGARPTCFFKGLTASGASVQRSVKAPIGFELDDNIWHIVRCERLQNRVVLYIDGVEVKRLVGSTGTIANTKNLSIGGKSTCDQIVITCDYFVGDIDWVRIEKGANTAPTASFTSNCTLLVCSFNASASSDPGGSIASYAWNFGNGTTGTGVTTNRTYATGGTYTVTLTVTDNNGATGMTTRMVTVSSSAIFLVGQATASGSASNHVTTVPSSVQAGDGLLLMLSIGTNATSNNPTGVTGWTQLDNLVGTNGSTRVWRKVATAGDAGSSVTVNVSAASKGAITVVAYRGTSTANPVANFARTLITTSSASRATPTVTLSAPRFVVSYWMHRDSATTALTPPGGVTVRASASQTGGGRATILLADSNGNAPAGSYGALTATAAAASTLATTWTIVLAPA